VHDSAYHYLKLHNDLENELQGEEASKRLAELEANLQAREHQKEIENERKIRDAQQKAAKREKQYMIGGGIIVIVMLLIFIVFMVNRNRMKQRANKQLELFNHQISEQKHLIEEKHKEITDSINYAERIQRSFLATQDMLDAHLVDYFVFFRPKDVVSGDFYWASPLNNGDFAFCCADSTGHGVPGAIMSILNISSLEKSIETQTEPHEILNDTRKIIVNRLKKDGSPEGGKDGMDCSLVVINPEKKQLSLAAANNPVFVIRNNEIIEWKGDKMPVGKHDKQDNSFTLHTFQLQKDDVIYTLTDGFPDQFGGDNGKKFMIKKLKELLVQIAPQPMPEQNKILNDVFVSWKGENEQVDDVCVIGVRV
jgi:serine phosphatase RsbU (regulator of sigma subunit)